MTNAYMSLGDLKEVGAQGFTGTTYDSRLLAWLESQSRLVDLHCRRQFYVTTATKFPRQRRDDRRSRSSQLSQPGAQRMNLPDDLIVATTLKEDSNGNGVYDITWAAADFFGWPDSHSAPDSGQDDAEPFTQLRVDENGGNQDVFILGQRRYELIGEWGYWKRLVTLGALVDDVDFDATQSTVPLDPGHGVSAGDTLLIDAEQLYVTAVVADILTVERGINGTIAASHSDDTPVDRYEYPGPIRDAVMMQSARLFGRRTHGYANQVGFNETGTFLPRLNLDDDVKSQLRGYVKIYA